MRSIRKGVKGEGRVPLLDVIYELITEEHALKKQGNDEIEKHIDEYLNEVLKKRDIIETWFNKINVMDFEDVICKNKTKDFIFIIWETLIKKFPFKEDISPKDISQILLISFIHHKAGFIIRDCHSGLFDATIQTQRNRYTKIYGL